MKIPNPLAYPLHSFAVLIVAITLGYLLFLAIDGNGLAIQETDSKVAVKEYRPVSQGTYSAKVGNTVKSFPMSIPEAWLITVEVDGVRGSAEVPRKLYDLLKEGDPVRVSYSRKRIRRTLTVLAIHKLGRTRVP